MKSLSEFIDEAMSSKNGWALSDKAKREMAEHGAGEFMSACQFSDATDGERHGLIEAALEFICNYYTGKKTSDDERKLMATYIKDCADYVYKKFVK